MNDRELLELAAKAAGITEGIGGAFWTDFGVFDPLQDDGDALRLAVKLRMTLFQCKTNAIAELDSDCDDPPIHKKNTATMKQEWQQLASPSSVQRQRLGGI